MKRLFLLRHAKASRDTPGLDDINRCLAERGRADAVRIGRFMRDEVYIPDLVLCSTSARTHETLSLLLLELDARPVVQYRADLYLAKPETILTAVRHARETAGSLMVVAHNPGIEECARGLVRDPADRKLRKRYQTMTEKFPTGALAVIDFDVRQWTEVGPGEGELELFIRPKDLRVDEV